MDLKLTNKTILVTAASTGLGYATALELAKEKANVMICGRSEQSLNAAVEKLKTQTQHEMIQAYAADLTDPQQIQQLVNATVSAFGAIDGLVTNAGGPPSGTFDTTDLSAWDKAFQLTLMSATRLIYAALPHLRKSHTPSILTVTSVSVKQPIPGLLLSNVFRPAVIGLTKSLSQELGPENVRVNSILPGWTGTDRTNELLRYRAEKNGTDFATEVEKVTEGIPLKRMATPDEFARVAAFLISPAASFISGVMLPVDGGSCVGLL